MAHVLCDSDTTRTASEPLVSVRALTVAYALRTGGAARPQASTTQVLTCQALTDIDLDIPSSARIGILGESGCGKSTLLLSLLNLLRFNVLTDGSVVYEGRNLLHESESALQRIRGARIGFVAQEAGTALNPLRRIGDQVAEVLRAHRDVSRRQTDDCVRASLVEVGLDANQVLKAWPHQLSGGQRQRVLIAQALICDPELLLADEPTHSLDERTRSEICSLFKKRTERSGMALLIASHDPKVLRALTQDVLVLYAGQIVESGRTKDVLESPKHPYTRALLGCFEMGERRAFGNPARLRTIPGPPPDPNLEATGCRFASRCSERRHECGEIAPALLPLGPDREVRCHLYD